jgi:hypothetical protein
MAVTKSVLELIARVRRERPGDLRGGGVDLGHALEASLYFTCVHDAGLLRLFHDPQDVAAVAHLQSPMARLIAENGFARGEALQAVRRRAVPLRLLQQIKNALPRLSHTAARLDGYSPPILFLARSQRFARFLRPLADALGRDCGFLVPAADAELPAVIRKWGFPCYAYPFGKRPQLQMGTLIADYARHWAGMTELFGDMLERLSPRLVVIPEGNAPDDEVLARAAEQVGIANACIQQGWSPILHPGFHNLRYDAMLVWGKGFAELLAIANPEQKFLVTGNFHLAESPRGTGAGILFLLQGFDNWMGGRKSADAMLNLAEGLAAALPDQPIFIRPHPVVPLPDDVRTRLTRYPNVRIEPAQEVPLAEAFAKSRISVSAYSSAILESVAAGVVPLVFNTAGMPRYWPDIEAAGAGLEIQTQDAALGAVRRMLQEEGALEAYREPMRVFTERFFQFRGASSIARNTAELRQLAGLT